MTSVNRIVLALGCAGALLIGCGQSEGHDDSLPPPPGELLKSDKARNLNPLVSATDLATLSADNTQFAVNLLHEVGGEGENTFFSPWSISVALGMTYAGAETNTESQMASAMQFTLAEPELHDAFNTIDLALNSRGEGAQGIDDKGFRLNILNNVWGLPGYPFAMPFLDVLAVNYGAGINLLDFVGAPELSRQQINDWVAVVTEDKIPELLPQGFINSNTRLVLTNAVYFNAAWKYPFETDATSSKSFTLASGQTVDVETMQQGEQFPFVSTSTYKAVELPYDGEELGMLVLLPELGHEASIASSLGPQFLADVDAGLATVNVDLALPKFELRSKFNLGNALQELGMTDAFDNALADFSGMDGGYGDLAISSVVHEAYVLVNERGTEAAAATAVGVGVTSAPVYEEMRVNRPFYVFIRDRQTKTVLFMGHVADPR